MRTTVLAAALLFLGISQLPCEAEPIAMPVAAKALTFAASPLSKLPAGEQCAYILAHENSGGELDSLNAAFVYRNCVWMGQHCVTIDYQRAIELFGRSGHPDYAAALLQDVKKRAASGDPRAISALQNMGLPW